MGRRTPAPLAKNGRSAVFGTYENGTFFCLPGSLRLAQLTHHPSMWSFLFALLILQCNASTMQLLHAQRGPNSIVYENSAWSWGGTIVKRLNSFGKLRIYAQDSLVRVAYARLRNGKNLCFSFEIKPGHSILVFEPTPTDSIVVCPAPHATLDAMCNAAVHFYWGRTDEAEDLLTYDDYANFGAPVARPDKANEGPAGTIMAHDNPLICSN